MSRAVLKFDAEAVARLITHASEATEWRHSEFEEGEPRPALMLVKDEGIYVMSNGVPALEPNCRVVYARNYDPRKGDVWDRCREAVGGDDFAEYIELAELGPVPEGASDLVIHITAKDFTVGWEVVVAPSNGHPVGQDDQDTTQPTQGGNMAGKPTRPPQTSASEIHPGGASRIAGQRAEKHSASVERAKNPGEPKELTHAPDATFAEVLGAPAEVTTMTDEEIAAMSPVDRINAAHREYEALTAWTKEGEQGPRPLTPIRDWDTRKSAEATGTSAEKGEGDMPKNSSNGNGKTPNRARVSSALPQTVRFTVDGKQVGETQNRLSSLARVTATDKAPRWTAGTFRQWIIDQGVADPLRSEWELTLPNGRKVGAVFSSPAAAAEAKKAAPAAKASPAKTPKTAAKKTAAPAKSASKRPTTRAGRREASARRLAAAGK